MMLHNMNNEELISWTLSSLFTPDDHTKRLAVELANRLEAAHDPEELEDVRDELRACEELSEDLDATNTDLESQVATLERELSDRDTLMGLVKEIYKIVEPRSENMNVLQMEVALDEVQGAIERDLEKGELE